MPGSYRHCVTYSNDDVVSHQPSLSSFQAEGLLTMTVNTACELRSNALHCVAHPNTTLLDCMLYRGISMIQAFYQARPISALILYLIRCIKETIL